MSFDSGVVPLSMFTRNIDLEAMFRKYIPNNSDGMQLDYEGRFVPTKMIEDHNGEFMWLFSEIVLSKLYKNVLFWNEIVPIYPLNKTKIKSMVRFYEQLDLKGGNRYVAAKRLKFIENIYVSEQKVEVIDFQYDFKMRGGQRFFIELQASIQ